MKQLLRFSVVLFALLAGGSLAGCNLMKASSSLPAAGDVTRAFETISVSLTQTGEPSATQSPVTPSPNSPAPTDPITPPVSVSKTATPAPSLSPLPMDCNRAAPGLPMIDITVEDNTEMRPGQRFTKIWRLMNAGECTWTRQYRAVWFFGEKLSDTLSVPLGEDVPPKSSVDITIDMVAPASPGVYQSNWKLSDADDALFGIGPDGNLPFWVKIDVVEADTPTPKPTRRTDQTPSPTAPTAPAVTSVITVTPTLTPTPTSTPVPLESGSVTLAIGSSLDLDSNRIADGPEADLNYQVDQNGVHWLVPQGTAELGVYGQGEPGLSTCQAAMMSPAPIPLESLSPGTYLCFRTNRDHPGWARYNSLAAPAYSLQVDFLTWERQ